MEDIEIRTVGEIDRPRVNHLLHQAFGGDPRPFDDDEPRFSDGERVVGAFDRERLVGTAMTHEFHQVFGGRAVPCGGVAGVVVAPNQRGRRVAQRMLVESLRRMRDRGEVTSSLYPTTARLYRQVGYEIAGRWARTRVPFAAVASGGPSPVWDECEFGSDEMRSILRRCVARHDGWVLPSNDWWDHQQFARREAAKRPFCYVARRDGEAVATVAYTYGDSERAMYDLQVQVLLGVDAHDFVDALAFLSANGTTAESMVTTLPRQVLDLALDRPELTSTEADWPWMLRIVDVAGALAARGYPAGVELSIGLLVSDPVLEANSQRWVFDVRDGEGRAHRGGEGTVEMAITALARLYAGVDPHRLSAFGHLRGATPEQLDALRTVFGSDPSLPIFF